MKVMIQNVRVSFGHGLFTASALEEGQQPKFGADFILEENSKVFTVKADGTKVASTMKQVMLDVANEAWKGKGQDMLDDLEASKKCYRNGNKRTGKDGEVYDGYEDKWYVTAKSATRPAIYNRDRSPISKEDGIVYSGCYVNVIFDVYANTQPKKKGVFAGLTGVQFFKDGDAFGGGGGTAKADDFDDLSDGSDADDMA